VSIAELTAEQKTKLVEYAKKHVEWLEKPEGLASIKEHREHEKYFKERLSPENVGRLTVDQFREVYKTLWASNIWSNKDWYVDHRLLEPNGLDKLRQELGKLLYGSEEIDKRYDEFKANVKGFGPSSLSEILHFVFPDRFCLWNEKPKIVLPLLGLNLLPERFFKFQIRGGDDYLLCVRALGAIKDELKDLGIADFIDLDIFFWHIFSDRIPPESPRVKTKPLHVVTKIGSMPEKIEISDHEGAEYYLLELGNKLGFFTYTPDKSKVFHNQKLEDVATLKEILPFIGERDIGSAREIDVIWLGEEDENPKDCFEVEHTTDIVRGLNRLAQLKHMNVKFFIVAPEDRRSKFENEMEKYPYRGMRDLYRFISYNELASLVETANPFYELKNKLLGE
jgi:hypothetical protein